MEHFRTHEKELREIEKIIDEYHKNHDIFKKPYQQGTIDILRVFEDLANKSMIIGASFSSFDMANGPVRDLLDALNMAVAWTYKLCGEKEVPFALELSNTEYWKSFDLLTSYAEPYTTICDAYIAYSRKKFEVNIEKNNVWFLASEDELKSFFADTSETLNEIDADSINRKVLGVFGDASFQTKRDLFFQSVHLDREKIAYDAAPLANAFLAVAAIHWEGTATLPQDWKFDHFSLQGFKRCWCELFSMALAHSLAYGICNDDAATAYNLIILSYESLVTLLTTRTGLEDTEVREIIQILLYNPKLKHSDIIYQPIVKLGDFCVIAPNLITSSRPERNLISVIQKTNDKEYFKRVNELERIMREEIASALPNTGNFIISYDVHLEDSLPDVDFAIYDKQSNSVLICELKWLIAADSASEVYARESDINHGCEQIDKIMGYAMLNRKTFLQKVFRLDGTEETDLFCCVISKHNVRSSNSHVPVICQKRFLTLAKSIPLSLLFHKIRTQDYSCDLPNGIEYAEKPVPYANYTFFIPALKRQAFDEDEILEKFLGHVGL